MAHFINVLHRQRPLSHRSIEKRKMLENGYIVPTMQRGHVPPRPLEHSRERKIRRRQRRKRGKTGHFIFVDTRSRDSLWRVHKEGRNFDGKFFAQTAFNRFSIRRTSPSPFSLRGDNAHDLVSFLRAERRLSGRWMETIEGRSFLREKLREVGPCGIRVSGNCRDGNEARYIPSSMGKQV